MTHWEFYLSFTTSNSKMLIGLTEKEKRGKEIPAMQGLREFLSHGSPLMISAALVAGVAGSVSVLTDTVWLWQNSTRNVIK